MVERIAADWNVVRILRSVSHQRQLLCVGTRRHGDASGEIMGNYIIDKCPIPETGPAPRSTRTRYCVTVNPGDAPWHAGQDRIGRRKASRFPQSWLRTCSIGYVTVGEPPRLYRRRAEFARRRLVTAAALLESAAPAELAWAIHGSPTDDKRNQGRARTRAFPRKTQRPQWQHQRLTSSGRPNEANARHPGSQREPGPKPLYREWRGGCATRFRRLRQTLLTCWVDMTGTRKSAGAVWPARPCQ